MQCKINKNNYENIKFVEVITSKGKLCIYENHISIAGSGLIVKIVLKNEEIININFKGVFYYNSKILYIISNI